MTKKRIADRAANDKPAFTRAQLDAGSEIVWEMLGDVSPQAQLDAVQTKLYTLGSRFQPL